MSFLPLAMRDNDADDEPMFLANCPQCPSPGLVGSGRILEFERTADGAHLIWYRCPAGHIAVEQLDAPRPATDTRRAIGVVR